MMSQTKCNTGSHSIRILLPNKLFIFNLFKLKKKTKSYHIYAYAVKLNKLCSRIFLHISTGYLFQIIDKSKFLNNLKIWTKIFKLILKDLQSIEINGLYLFGWFEHLLRKWRNKRTGSMLLLTIEPKPSSPGKWLLCVHSAVGETKWVNTC